MTYLVAAAERRDLAAVREASPELWRQVRRYNLPVQLALAAAHEAGTHAENIETAALISLAPCQAGSPDLYRWGELVVSYSPGKRLGEVRVNPTHTLHAVDNLALSAFAIAHGNHVYGLGLGGAAGQAWCGLEAVLERLASGHETEALLMAGDQDSIERPGAGLGVALLFSRLPKPCAALGIMPHSRGKNVAPRRGGADKMSALHSVSKALPLGRLIKLIAVERQRQAEAHAVRPHAAAGVSELLAVMAQHRRGRLSYRVPVEHGDGVDQVTVVMERL